MATRTRESPAASCSGFSAHVSGIAQQFGFATMPWCSRRAVAVHLRHDKRDAGLEPVGRRLVDADRAAADGVGDELAARLGADREEAEVEIARGEHCRGRLLDGRPAELLPGRPRRGEQAHVAVAALAQELDRDGSDCAGRADDR